MSPSLTTEPVVTQSPLLATAIVTYLDRSGSGRPQSAALTFVDNAIVVTDGTTYTGRAAIAAWLSDTAAELEYTTTQLSLGSDDTSTTVVNRIEGNFPGRRVDLSYRFELDAETGLIQRLMISQ